MGILETNEILKTKSTKGHRLTAEESDKLKKIVLEILCDVVAVCEEQQIPYMLGGGTALGAVRHQGFIPWDDDIDINVPRKYIAQLTDSIKCRYGDKYSIDIPAVTAGYLSSFVQVHKCGTVFREFLVQERDKCGIKIDIFPIENTYNNPILRRIHGISCEIGLFILSCYRMFAWRKQFKEMAEGSIKIEIIFGIKAAIGCVFAPLHGFWYKQIQKVFAICKDDTSDYVVIPSGRGHFWRELYKRNVFLQLQEISFEDRKFMITKDWDEYLKCLYGNYMEMPPKEKRERHVIYEIEF